MEQESNLDKYKELVEKVAATNKELAKFFGVTLRTVYRWNNGEFPVPMSAIRALQLLLKNK